MVELLGTAPRSSIVVKSLQRYNVIYTRKCIKSQPYNINNSMEQKSCWQKFKDWWTIDHVVDLVVDALLLIWEVIASPILIVVRVIRHLIGDWFTSSIKRIIKGIARWFARKREYRKAHGHGVFRTYWLLILTSPITLFILFCLTAIITGVAGDLPEMLELLIRGCESLKPGAEEYWCNIS